MKAIIMAGGAGTRLLPLTSNQPKPLTKLCGKPTCSYILDLLKKHHCDEATFTLMYLGEKIESEYETGSYRGMKLNFSYETQPLGTAGCVKYAIQNVKNDRNNEPFIVISGDALCDFNLSAAYKFHCDNNADATIIVKEVDDPREFGVINSKGSEIIDFSEKPSYSSCINNTANTGIYIISKKVLRLIPDNKACDFARDVFPEMLRQKMKLLSYEEKGYWCDIGDLVSYRTCQKDILTGKVECDVLDKYTKDRKFPEVDTIRPYYIGENVHIGKGTVIKDGTVIDDNVTIGDKCHITASIIHSGSFISDNVALSGAIICENVSIKENSSVYENAVIGNNSVIGKSCIVSSNVKVWNNKDISTDTTLNNDVEFGEKHRLELSENGFVGVTNISATPQLMSTIGGAVATISTGKIIVASRNNIESKAFAQSILSGVSSSGKDVFFCGEIPLPLLVHQCRLTNSELMVYISVGVITKVTILNKGGMPLTRKQERSLESLINRGGILKAAHDKFGEIKYISGSISQYQGMLEHSSDFISKYNIFLDCNNDFIKKYITPVFQKISSQKGEKLIVTISNNGTKSELFTQNAGKIGYEKLLLISCIDLLEKGLDVSLPNSVLFDMENIAISHNHNAYRFNSCSNDNSDIEARRIAEKQPFLIDGIVLALSVIAYAESKNKTLEQIIEGLPVFESEKRFMKINCPSPQVLKKLCENNTSHNEGVMISQNDEKILIRSNKSGDGLFLFAQSLNVETAKTLCDDTEAKVRELIKKYNTENK